MKCSIIVLHDVISLTWDMWLSLVTQWNKIGTEIDTALRESNNVLLLT